MKTSKPISTISFNTYSFLCNKMDYLLKHKILSYYAFIQHEPEPDETKDECSGKTHFHIYCELASLTQTEDLREQFKEADPNNDLPLSVMPFRASKWADWYLYSLHDPVYLATKGLTRAYAYTDSDIYTSDKDYMNTLISEIDSRHISRYQTMMDYIRSNSSFAEYIVSENVDIRFIHQYERAYKHLSDAFRLHPKDDIIDA